MIELDSNLASSLYRETGYRFANYYCVLSHKVSQNLKPELRWKKATRKFWKSRYKLTKEMELNFIALLDKERDNLFYSIEWAHHHLAWKLVCQIMDDLSIYFNNRSYWPEWVHFAELAVSDANKTKDPKLKADALNNLSVVYRQFERLSESIKCCQESIKLTQERDNRYGEGLSLGNIGGTYFAQNDFQASYQSYLAAIKIFEMLGELYEQSQCLMGIGIVLAKQQKLDEASTYLTACIKIQNKIGDRFGEAQTLNNLGIVQKMQKRFSDAIKSFQKSLLIKQEIGDQQGVVNSLTNLAVAYEKSGQISHAITTWEKSLNLLREVNLSDYERASRRLRKLRLQIKDPN